MSHPHYTAKGLGTHLQLLESQLKSAIEVHAILAQQLDPLDSHPWEAYDLADMPGLHVSVNQFESKFRIMAGSVDVTDYVDGNIFAFCKRFADKIIGDPTKQTQSKPEIS